MGMLAGYKTKADRGANSGFQAYTQPFASTTPMERGRIIAQNRDERTGKLIYSYQVKTQSGKYHQNVQVACAYFNSINGTGMYMVPDINCQCLIGYIEGDHPVIVAFLGCAEDNNGYQNLRLDLSPGSMAYETSSGAAMVIENSGILEMRASPLSRRLYIRPQNLIYDQCANYHMDAGGGIIRWIHEYESEDSTRANVNYVHRSYQTNDLTTSKWSEIRMGKNERLAIKTGEPSGTTEKVTTEISVDGESNLSIKGAMATGAAVSVNISKDGEIDITGRAGAKVTIDPSGAIKIEGPSLEIDVADVSFKKPVQFDSVVSMRSQLDVSGLITARGGLADFWDPET